MYANAVHYLLKFSALMISTFMKRLAAAVVASHITITAGLHVYGKRKRLQEDDDYEESKVTGQGVCVCLRMYMSMDVSGIPSTSTIAAYSHLYSEMKTSGSFDFRNLWRCWFPAALSISNWFDWHTRL